MVHTPMHVLDSGVHGGQENCSESEIIFSGLH